MSHKKTITKDSFAEIRSGFDPEEWVSLSPAPIVSRSDADTTIRIGYASSVILLLGLTVPACLPEDYESGTAGFSESNGSSSGSTDFGTTTDGESGIDTNDGGPASTADMETGGSTDAGSELPAVTMWSGTTTADDPVLLAIDSEGVLLGLVVIDVYIDVGFCSGTVALTARETPNVLEAGGNVSIAVDTVFPPMNLSDEASISVSLEALDLSGQAGGYIQRYNGGFGLICGEDFIVGTDTLWEQEMWLAEPCPECTPECPFVNNGVCDEPLGGTGLCFLGFDPGDC